MMLFLTIINSINITIIKAHIIRKKKKSNLTSPLHNITISQDE